MVTNPTGGSSVTPIYVIQLRDEAGAITDYIFATELARFSAASLALQPELGEILMQLDRELAAHPPQRTMKLESSGSDFDWFRYLATKALSTDR